MTFCDTCFIFKTSKWYFRKNIYKRTLCKKCYDNKRNSDTSIEFKNRKKQYKINEKMKALRKCSSIICINCGQSNIRVLEFNMIGGGHTKLVRDKKMSHGENLQRDIIAGRVDCKLFDIRCKVCNMAEYVERVFGLKYTINIYKTT